LRWQQTSIKDAGEIGATAASARFTRSFAGRRHRACPDRCRVSPGHRRRPKEAATSSLWCAASSARTRNRRGAFASVEFGFRQHRLAVRVLAPREPGKRTFGKVTRRRGVGPRRSVRLAGDAVLQPFLILNVSKHVHPFFGRVAEHQRRQCPTQNIQCAVKIRIVAAILDLEAGVRDGCPVRGRTSCRLPSATCGSKRERGTSRPDGLRRYRGHRACRSRGIRCRHRRPFEIARSIAIRAWRCRRLSGVAADTALRWRIFTAEESEARNICPSRRPTFV